ncbi:MAG: heat-inducible transcriptional repressor HrcA [Clostridiales bacterium]|uniref:heat-inducible transcriptional repressor HrcA n=1 Tax=Chordicoccus furentiruminis TaxID=2709410 RepID=UPI0023A89E1C|nr:heat-inducible transcriptional repressor HrcA [Chordicoccus furentiruminis]MCI6173973.1 heat-inducible transcriptional repressor HrcA [Clostridiales bacterium]
MTILNAIIQTYMKTGEPVGSRTISKYTDLNVSSATIRNEMSDLEEMGYIIQPHTSAGRIPTDKAYRLYVDRLVTEKTEQVTAMNSLMIAKTNRMEEVLKQLVRMLAANTNYTAMMTSSYKGNKVKFIQLSRLSPKQLLNVVVIEGNVVKNHIIDLDEEISEDQVLKLNLLLNTRLCGLSLAQINLGLISNIKEEAQGHSRIVSEVLDTIADVIRAETDEDMTIYTSGANNIFKYPELSEGSKASELISTLEEKDVLADFVKQTEENDSGIQVYIGDESPVASMKDCSVVTATYELGDGMQGTIGIIGPKRMDYKKVMDNLKTVKATLNEVFGNGTVRRLTGKKEESEDSDGN